jgi:hypothetical protein
MIGLRTVVAAMPRRSALRALPHGPAKKPSSTSDRIELEGLGLARGLLPLHNLALFEIILLHLPAVPVKRFSVKRFSMGGNLQ